MSLTSIGCTEREREVFFQSACILTGLLTGVADWKRVHDKGTDCIGNSDLLDMERWRGECAYVCDSCGTGELECWLDWVCIGTERVAA